MFFSFFVFPFVLVILVEWFNCECFAFHCLIILSCCQLVKSVSIFVSLLREKTIFTSHTNGFDLLRKNELVETQRSLGEIKKIILPRVCFEMIFHFHRKALKRKFLVRSRL